MKALEICTCIGCVNNCKYCPQQKITRAYNSDIRVMSFQMFKTCLDTIKNTKILIDFCGMAEPFQNPACIDMIEYANRQGYTIDLFTTGIGMNLEHVERLKKIPFHYIELHLPDDRELTDIKVDDNYVAVIKAIFQANFKNIHYQVFGTLHPKIKEILGFMPEDLSRLLQNRAGNLKDNFYMPAKTLKGNIECRSHGKSFEYIVLLPNGEVTICDLDYSLKYVFGNLLKNSMEELYSSEKYKGFVKALEGGGGDILCRTCSYARERNGIEDFVKAKWNDSRIKVWLYKIYKNLK